MIHDYFHAKPQPAPCRTCVRTETGKMVPSYSVNPFLIQPFASKFSFPFPRGEKNTSHFIHLPSAIMPNSGDAWAASCCEAPQTQSFSHPLPWLSRSPVHLRNPDEAGGRPEAKSSRITWVIDTAIGSHDLQATPQDSSERGPGYILA
jgi:hypothetical protein